MNINEQTVSVTLKNQIIHISSSQLFFSACVIPGLLYGCKNWCLTERIPKFFRQVSSTSKSNILHHLKWRRPHLLVLSRIEEEEEDLCGIRRDLRSAIASWSPIMPQLIPVKYVGARLFNSPFIPRPSQRPVYDCLQYVKEKNWTEGIRPGNEAIFLTLLCVIVIEKTEP